MKKIIQAISVVLAMLLLVSAISVAPFATTDPAIVVNGADTAEPGATVELTVDAQNFEGANIFGMQFDIDLGGLTDVEITAGALLEGIDFEGNMVEGVYKVAEINNVSEDDVATYFGNGTIFTISGKVSETVADTHTVEVKDIVCCDFENVEEIAVTGGSKTVTVEEAVVADVLNVTSAKGTGFASRVEFGINFEVGYEGSGTPVNSGAVILRADQYTEGTEITKDTANVLEFKGNSYMTAYGATVTNVAVSRYNIDYIFVPFVILEDGTYVYGQSSSYSYMDYLISKVTTQGTSATTLKRSQANIDTYYALTKDATIAEYAGTVDIADKTKTYVPTYAEVNYTNPNPSADLAVTKADMTGFGSRVEFGINFGISYTGTGTPVNSGAVILRADQYTAGMEITKDTAGVLEFKGDSYMPAYGATVANISIARYSIDYIFVPFVVLEDGTYVYGEYSEVCYADYLISRLKTLSGDNLTRVNSALNSYAAIFGTALYTEA